MNSDELEVISLQPQNPEPPRNRAKRADAVANREQILTTAQHLFNQKGVPNVCMAEIAEAAKIGKGTLYRSFAHKGELCLALMDEDMRGFQNRTLQVFKDRAGSPALELLDTFLDRLTHFMTFHAPLMREVQKHQDFQEDALPHRTSPQMWLPWLRDTISILLQRADRNGETESLDNPFLVEAILAPLSADVFIYQREVLGFDTERISRGVRRLVLYGCKTSPGQ